MFKLVVIAVLRAGLDEPMGTTTGFCYERYVFRLIYWTGISLT